MSNTMDFSAVIGIKPGDMPPSPVEIDDALAATSSLPIQSDTPAITALMSMDAPRAALEPFRNRALELKAEAKSMQVKDHESQVAATNLAATIKKITKTVEDARKNYTNPINEHIRSVNGLAKEVSSPLEDGLNHLLKEMNQYAAQVELERRKAAEEARRRAAEEQQRLNAEAKSAGVEAPLVPEIVPAKKSAAVRTENGTSFQRKTWTFEVENMDKVPREYLVLNEKAVRTAISNGVRAIAGIKIYETATTVIK